MGSGTNRLAGKARRSAEFGARSVDGLRGGDDLPSALDSRKPTKVPYPQGVNAISATVQRGQEGSATMRRKVSHALLLTAAVLISACGTSGSSATHGSSSTTTVGAVLPPTAESSPTTSVASTTPPGLREGDYILNEVTVKNGEPVGHYSLMIANGLITYKGPFAGFTEHLSGQTPGQFAVSGDTELCTTTGLYAFQQGSTTLTFTPVNDPCGSRVDFLTLGSWAFGG